MFNYQDKIVKKFKVIDWTSIGLNIAFLGLFTYIYYMYNKGFLEENIFLISSGFCFICLIGLFTNRIKFKKEIVNDAKKEAEYKNIEEILSDLMMGKIVCIQSSQDMGFIKKESDKILFYLKNGNQKIERSIETAKMHINRLLKDPSTGLYQNGFLFVIKETNDSNLN